MNAGNDIIILVQDFMWYTVERCAAGTSQTLYLPGPLAVGFMSHGQLPLAPFFLF